MTWIAIDTDIGNHPKTWAMVDATGAPRESIVGCLTMLFGAMKEHASDGSLATVSDSALEAWAGWTGQRGAFAQGFRGLFVKDGVVTGWERRNGKLQKQYEEKRARWRLYSEERRKSRAVSQESPESLPKVSETSPPYIYPDLYPDPDSSSEVHTDKTTKTRSQKTLAPIGLPAQGSSHEKSNSNRPLAEDVVNSALASSYAQGVHIIGNTQAVSVDNSMSSTGFPPDATPIVHSEKEANSPQILCGVDETLASPATGAGRLVGSGTDATASDNRLKSDHLARNSRIANALAEPCASGNSCRPGVKSPPEEVASPQSPSQQESGKPPSRAGLSRSSVQGDSHVQGRKAKRKEPIATWLTPVEKVWEEWNGVGSFKGQIGVAMTYLSPLYQAHGADTLAAHVGQYLAETDGNPHYRSLQKFASNFASYAPKPMFVNGVPADWLWKATEPQRA